MSALTPLRFEDGRLMLLAGLRQRHALTENDAGLGEQWRRFEELGPLPGQVGERRYGVMCGADAQSFEYRCAVEVIAFDEHDPGLGRMRITPQRYAVFAHRGTAATLGKTWRAILFDWLPNSSYRSAHRPDFELYGAGQEPARPDGEIEIWVAIV
ncbi:GyrI-like domain-containing protein [Crenobacter sp. SG2303]|uniref:GyrI-like domain-containing protein n=1 Tax=Crenobacter oryzisoli TaxID=3056844 RepID=A0ABT7XJY1_9NEIS|nr:GyrI-like domain-containing protein [Crenobacter sp. SG2303]MDN0074101.1 GyrI-like domain-containing protein [Crenobacter sp. SG2303]